MNKFSSWICSFFKRKNRIFNMSEIASIGCNEASGEEDDISFSHALLSSYTKGKKGDNVEKAIHDFLKEVRYPPVKDFKKGLEWFNTSEPLSFSDHLKGKVVLLDFFTYCCINCMHILPDLKEIEEEFSIEDGLVVIGVHSAKFENEKNSSNILAAVQRYNIKHPVVNDKSMDMWQKCNVECWPTLLLLGPYANPIVMLTGEGHKNELKLYIKHVLKYYESNDLLSSHKLPIKSAYHLLPDTKGPLLFPGKLTNFLDNEVELIAISDSGNNRVLLIDGDAKIIKKIGSGNLGFKDGTLENAEFNNPQGLIFKNKDVIYVADTDNHAIREINLIENTVQTIVGTGYQLNYKNVRNKGTDQAISSPWDLVLYQYEDNHCNSIKDVLIIAMAGTHQIWAYFFQDTTWWKNTKYEAKMCVAIAGSGSEENRNNHYPNKAAFAQPSGLALCKTNKEVYIADSESSSVRKLSLIDGKVAAVVGGDKNPYNLFAFGDIDGTLFEAKLQHALGLTMAEGNTLFVADTYNHKIKKINATENSIVNLKFPENASNDKKLYNFKEPAGLCFNSKNNKLYIADTNNHCIKVIEFDSKYEITKLYLLDVQEPIDKTESDGIKTIKQSYKSKELTLSKSACKTIIHLSIKLSNGLKLTEGAPQKWEINLSDSIYSVVPMSGKNIDDIDLVVNLPAANTSTQKNITVIFNLTTCTDKECLPKMFAVNIPIRRLDSVSETKFEHLVKVDITPSEINVV